MKKQMKMKIKWWMIHIAAAPDPFSCQILFLEINQDTDFDKLLSPSWIQVEVAYCYRNIEPTL